MSADEEFKWRYIPVVGDYAWPPVASINDCNRARIDDAGRPWIDDVRVNVKMHRQFMEEWSAFYDARLVAGNEQTESNQTEGAKS